MRTALLTLAALLLVLLAAPGDASFNKGGGRRRLEVTCSQVKPQDICDGKNRGFQVTDGCNTCECNSQPGKLVCSIKSCPREDELTDNRLKRRASRYCAKLVRKVQKRLRKFQKKTAAAAAAAAAAAVPGSEQQRWPIKCFKERKLCRKLPGVAFFDGCNRCRCPSGRDGASAAAAQCEATNACPDFVGSRNEFKRRCAALGARIEGGGREGRSGRRGGGSGRRRQQRRQEEEEVEGGATGNSLVRRLLSRY